MSKKKDPWAEDAKFDQNVKENVPASEGGSGEDFIALDKNASLFIMMPRVENKDVFFLSTMKHHGIYATREDGTRRQTSRVCLRAANEGPCALCDIVEALENSMATSEVKIRERLTPRKQVMVSVWWIPLTPAIGTPSAGVHVINLGKDFVVTEAPSLRVLGFPKGVWGKLKDMVRARGGVDRFVGRMGPPVYVLGNGKDKMERRYNDPAELFLDEAGFPEELRPPKDITLQNVRKLMDYPKPYEVAQVAEQNFPGILKDLTVYGTVEPEEEAPEAEASGGDAFKEGEES
jgi:hypothetical protein